MKYIYILCIYIYYIYIYYLYIILFNIYIYTYKYINTHIHIHSVHWGINPPPPQKCRPPLFCQAPPLNLQIVQAPPPFR